MLLVLEDVLVEVVIEEGNNQPSILVVRYSASIVTLGCQVFQSCEGNFVAFVEEHLQLADRYSQIRLVEFVANVPSQRAVLSSLLDDCMEECQRIH